MTTASWSSPRPLAEASDEQLAEWYAVFRDDPHLLTVRKQIVQRIARVGQVLSEIQETEGSLRDFAGGHLLFGFSVDQSTSEVKFREYLPCARRAWLTGEFDGWKRHHCELRRGEFGRFELALPQSAEELHGTQVRVVVETETGEVVDRVPAYTLFAVQDKRTFLFNCQVQLPSTGFQFRNPRPPTPAQPVIYEAHVGLCSPEERVGTYAEFTSVLLPKLSAQGYNCLQLMAVAEHADYASFGYHVTSFFGVASRSGSIDDFKKLVDEAHRLGIVVLLDIVHAHCSRNANDGIGYIDGTDHTYTHAGPKGHHTQWDSSLFNYASHETQRLLLSNLRYWAETCGVDGFRFDGVTSMLYDHHGIGVGFTGDYTEYFGGACDEDAIVFMAVANELCKGGHLLDQCPGVLDGPPSNAPLNLLTIAEDVSGFPTLCRPVSEGGVGFDFRLAMAWPDEVIKMLKGNDEDWDLDHMTHVLTNRRFKERCVAYVESHDQSIVGDKTSAFQLMDAEMYTGMTKLHGGQGKYASFVIERGIAFHKMLRLLTFGLGGEAYLTFCGNEFGHPEWVDMPRPGNGDSYKHCRRQWGLERDNLLFYGELGEFESQMNHACTSLGWMDPAGVLASLSDADRKSPAAKRLEHMRNHQFVGTKHTADKLLCFERGCAVFAFNFSHDKKQDPLYLGHCFGDEDLVCVLSSDLESVGGLDRVATGTRHPSVWCSEDRPSNSGMRPAESKAYLPPRCAAVFAPLSVALLVGLAQP